MIRNPILPGFHPDPSICRVGKTFYIATSTFEWYPGVRIYASEDLANWRFVSAPLDRTALLDMRGNPDSCGIWAPCLSHDGQRFWLVYTDVKRLDGAFKDAHNYITACDTIDGHWCDPWYVNSSGFDPSLFHDEDGRKWFVNMRWNHRGKGTGGNPKHASFDGILLQEWSSKTGLVGEAVAIFDGTERGLTEAPHLFRRNGWYYLTTAEGGTGYDHAVTLARSRQIAGPYELHPQKFVLSTKGATGHPLQRTGHGQYVEAEDGSCWHTYLTGRPIAGPDGTGRFCTLGRETGIARVVWKDDWLWLEDGGLLPPLEVDCAATSPPAGPSRYAFDSVLHDDFQWLRTPERDRIFRIENGALVLVGRESMGSWFEQALVARRQQHHSYRAETIVDVRPASYQHAAGLTTYYNRHKYHALLVTHEPGLGRALTIQSCPGNWPDCALEHPLDAPVPLGNGPVRLAVEVDAATQRFFYAEGDGEWTQVGPVLNAAVISDEGGRGEHASFTGAFVGMVAYDTSGMAGEARFSEFTYVPGGQG